MSVLHRLPAILISLAMASPALAQTPELIVQVDRQTIYEGESITWQVLLNHVDNPQAPDVSQLADFDVSLLQTTPMNSTQITIINGRRSETVRRGVQYTYQLTPRRSGTLTIPAPSVTVDGHTLHGEEIRVQVIPPEEQNHVIVEQSVNQDAVYPMQPVTLQVTVAVRQLPGQFAERDPMTVQPEPPQLSIEWLQDDQLPQMLQPQQSWRQILEPLVSRRGSGFQVNNIGASSAFSLFERRATGFHPTPRPTTRTNDEGQQIGYWEYDFQRTLIPQRPGEYRFPPATIKGTFADEAEGGQLSGRQIYALSAPLQITVKDVPLEGRPESWIGAVGQFEVLMQLRPDQVRVGDPLTLTMVLQGQGNLAEARPPDLNTLPDIAAGFRIYDASEETVGAARQFTWSLRPLNSKLTEFPSIPVSWFDVEQEKFVTYQTDPVPLTVTEAETMSTADVVVSGNSKRSTASDMEQTDGGVFANISDVSQLRDDGVQAFRWLTAWGGILAGSLLTSATLGFLQQRRSDPARQRKKAAPAAMATALKEAEQHQQAGDSAAACDCVHRAIATLVAAWADIPEAGVTAGDAARQLKQLGIPNELCHQTQQLLQECDAARYGALQGDITQLISQSRQLGEQLQRHSSSRRDRGNI